MPLAHWETHRMLMDAMNYSQRKGVMSDWDKHRKNILLNRLVESIIGHRININERER